MNRKLKKYFIVFYSAIDQVARDCSVIIRKRSDIIVKGVLQLRSVIKAFLIIK